MASTKNCIVCFEKPTYFGGHVHKNTDKIVASFCDKHFKQSQENPDCKGCFGVWNEKMGIDHSFGQVMYIDPQ